MYIKELEIENFKSFSSHKTVYFNQGLTVITGPNGSGKTNLLDSIKFVFAQKDYRIIENKDYINNQNQTQAIVKVVTDSDEKIERILQKYPSGKTRSKYFINDKQVKEKVVLGLFKKLKVEIIDACCCKTDNNKSEEFAKELKKKSSDVQILVVSHNKNILEAADYIIALNNDNIRGICGKNK